MKILFIITGLGLGGAERQVCDLADSMANLGHAITIIALTGTPAIAPNNSAITIHSLQMEKNLLSTVKIYMATKKFIALLKPDIIHAHMFHANIFARLLKPFFNKTPLICTAHNTNEGGNLRMKTYRLTNYLSDTNTNVSQEAVMAFEEKKAVPLNSMQVIYNGINPENFKYSATKRKYYRSNLNIEKQNQILIAIGRLEYQKDYPNLINAFQKNLIINPNLKLWIVGEGSQRANLEKLISDKKLSNHIQLLGLQQDIAGLLSAADLFVLSSAYEGFGLVVAEAMLTEKIVVATDCGGVAEVLGSHGFLCSPQNSDALTEKINLALNLPASEYNQLKQQAREHIIQNFSLEKITNQWLNLYQQLINNKSVRK